MLSSNKTTPSLYHDINSTRQRGEKMLAILIDPDKFDLDSAEEKINRIKSTPATHIFVGGSLVKNHDPDKLVRILKIKTALPVILFPGNPSQISLLADGILFLSLLSGRNPDYLIEHQVKAAPILKQSALEIIPTGYILAGTDDTTSVSRISQTKPIPFEEAGKITATAIAGEMMGKKLIYLEAGSGAKQCIPAQLIRKVAQNLNIPLIVGGGITSLQKIQQAYDAGADLVVIGTAFEKDPYFFEHG